MSEVTEISIVEIERMLKKRAIVTASVKVAVSVADSEHLHGVNHGDGCQPRQPVNPRRKDCR